MKPLLDWFDQRTGYRGLARAALYEHVPGGARWRYVWGSTLTFTFACQLITGFFLWMNYSPSAQTAWESVYYIQHEMSFGWLLRGLHHYTAQAMIVLLALHMMQVIIDGAYRAPREINFWIGLLLLMVTLGLSLTGYLLPWDQKGYWSTKVATTLIGLVPGVGASLQRVVVGGPDYGHHTLTRFFALHAGLLPLTMMGLIAVHVYVFRRHGLTVKEPRRKPDATFWVDQVLRDAVACLAVLAVVVFLCVKFGLFGGGWDHPGRLGAELGAPADPSEAFDARPEWYFLFLFQFIKSPWFEGAQGELIGAILIPGIVMLVLFVMPIIGRWRAGHWFNVFFTIFLLAAVVLLTTLAVFEDAGRPHLAAPFLTKYVGPGTVTAILAALIAGVVLLAVLFAAGRTRARGSGFTFGLLAALLVAAGAAAAVVMAGGLPVDNQSRPVLGPPILHVGSVGLDWLFVLMFALALLLVVALTISLAAAPAAATSNGGTTAELTPWQRLNDRHDVGPRLVLGLLVVLLLGAILLIAMRIKPGGKKLAYAAAVEQAHLNAERAVELASISGIPPQGAATLLREDPKTQGPRLFNQHCASCHRWGGGNAYGQAVADPQTAPDLKGFATREWLAGMLDPTQVDSVRYFGPRMPRAHEGKMVKFVKEEVPKFDSDQRKLLDQAIVALSAEAQLKSQREMDRRDAALIAEGKKALANEDIQCIDCHRYHTDKGGLRNVPELTGYGSRQWLIDFIRNPAHPRFYGRNNENMPLYGEQNLLDDKAIGLVADWIRGEWPEPGEPSAPLVAAKPAPATVAPPAGTPTGEPPAPSTRAAAAEAERTGTAAPATAPATQPKSADVKAEAEAGAPRPMDAAKPPMTRPAAPATAPTTATMPAAGGGPVDFVAQIQPIFEANCVACHGPTKRQGLYRMHTKAQAFKGGKSGAAAVVAGDSGASNLFGRISTRDPDERMPPADDEHKPLSPEQIDLVRRWIEGGATWPDGVELKVPPGKDKPDSGKE